MPRTRSRAGGNDDAGGSGLHGDDNENLPPLPLPTPEELMAMLAKGQRAMGKAMRTVAQQVAQGRHQR